MAVPQDAIPSLEECQCLICMDILIEPVTLPCNHTLCNQCFQSTIEKTSLCCPFCRHRISSRSRHLARRNSLINMKLWQIIQKHYPEECRLRMSGQDSRQVIDDFKPIHIISKPGELRREYEEEVSKLEAERRAIEREENKTSEEYIQRLLAEEEARRQARKRRREKEEQLKSDEELARKLSVNINCCDENILPSPLNSRKSSTVTGKSQKKSKNTHTNTEDIEKFGSTSQSEVVQGSRRISVSKETESTVVKSPVSEVIEIEDDTPTFFPQICMGIQEQGAKSSVEPPVPQLYTNGRESCFERKIKVTRSNRDKELHDPNHKRPGATIPCFGKMGNACAVSGMTLVIEDDTTDTEDDDCLLIGEDSSKGKNQQYSFQAVRDPCISAKRKKMFPKASSTQEATETITTQNPIDPDCFIVERNKQEEHDWMFAFQLQKEVDKERKKLNCQKGSPDEYQLCPTTSLPNKVLSGEKKHSKDKNFKRETNREPPKF